MDWTQLAGWAMAAVVTAVIPIVLPRVLTLIDANIHNKDVALIAGGAARAAGRIALQVAQARAAQPGVPIGAIISAQLAAEQVNVQAMLKETVAKLGVSPDAVGQMIQGELGKLLPPESAPVIQGIATTLEAATAPGLADQVAEKVLDVLRPHLVGVPAA
ncbi:MAG: hypothetical protein JWR10_3641 [Rubritepida sp.]|nr:hypothetical protein [Rubritepida sp.]